MGSFRNQMFEHKPVTMYLVGCIDRKGVSRGVVREDTLEVASLPMAGKPGEAFYVKDSERIVIELTRRSPTILECHLMKDGKRTAGANVPLLSLEYEGSKVAVCTLILPGSKFVASFNVTKGVKFTGTTVASRAETETVSRAKLPVEKILAVTTLISARSSNRKSSMLQGYQKFREMRSKLSPRHSERPSNRRSSKRPSNRRMTLRRSGRKSKRTMV